MGFVAPQRVVVAHAIAEAPDVVQVRFLGRAVRQNRADAFAVFLLELVEGLYQVVRHLLFLSSGWRGGSSP